MARELSRQEVTLPVLGHPAQNSGAFREAGGDSIHDWVVPSIVNPDSTSQKAVSFDNAMKERDKDPPSVPEAANYYDIVYMLAQVATSAGLEPSTAPAGARKALRDGLASIRVSKEWRDPSRSWRTGTSTAPCTPWCWTGPTHRPCWVDRKGLDMTQTAVNGLLLGGNYALLALGYTLVFGVTRLLTLAHGEVFMVSAAVALLAMRTFGLPLPMVIAVAVAVGGLAGILTDLLCLRPVSREFHLAPAVATIGLALAIQYSLIAARGSSNPIGVPPTFRPAEVHLGTLLISVPQIVMLGLSILLMLGLWWFIHATRWGAALRGMSEDPATVELLGINARGLGTAVLAASGMLAGAAGVLIALRDGSVSPFAGTAIGLKGLAIMAVAGLGSLAGAVVVGVALGMAEVFASYYQLGWVQSALPWILVVAVLLVRPQGLFSRARR